MYRWSASSLSRWPEAFKSLLKHLPADTGLAFVFIQHLDPKHQSNLSEILDA